MNVGLERLSKYRKIETLNPDIRICVQCGSRLLNVENNEIRCSNCSALYHKKLVPIKGGTT